MVRVTPQSWSHDDDDLLIMLKEQQGLGWKQIASHFKGRTANACQFRWRRLKSGTLKNARIHKPAHWSLEEDRLLLSSQLSLLEISVLLPDKPLQDIKQRLKMLQTRRKLSVKALLNHSTNTSTTADTADNTPDTVEQVTLPPLRPPQDGSQLPLPPLASLLSLS